MKFNVFFLGVLLIISAVTEYVLSPMILDKVNSITTNIETMIPAMTNNPQNQAYASMLADTNAQVSQFTSNVTMLETNVMYYTTWGTVLVGIGLVSYGMLVTNNRIIKTNTSTALGILKMRLVKGEITKSQYDQLKNDVV